MVKSIYLAEVLFTNQISSKVRPVLILKQNSFGDLIYMPISTNMLNKGIEISNLDFDSGNIPQMSKIIIEKIGVIHSSLLIKKLATLSDLKFQNIINEFILFLK